MTIFLKKKAFLLCVSAFAILCNFEQEASAAPMRRADELISRQTPPKVSARLLSAASQDNTSVHISLSKQRAYLLVNGEIAIDTPISSGKSKGMTPTGSFKVTEKDADHRSNIYGNYVDSEGRVVRGGVSVKIDSAPSGTHFVGAPMRYFMRFSGAVGMHVGHLPGYPASHGCVRMPPEIAPLFYKNVKHGTSVRVVE
jgi:lipoprotein-anchoring transpeptidase ErfK/SrfK